ncbi:MAG TPA: hypothetical protein VF803_00825 [Candidatus Paceibacterota bacterium]
MLEKEDVSPMGVGKLLATQPAVIAHLFDRLLDECDGKAPADDMSISVIIGALGVQGVERLLEPITEVPFRQRQAWRDMSADAYARARMMAWIADPKHNHDEVWGLFPKAQIYFLYGLIADIVADDERYLQCGHKAERFFPSLDGEKLAAFARTNELLIRFKKGDSPIEERALFREWQGAMDRIRGVVL